MNNYTINGFIKRAQQYGLDENQIENLVKKAFNVNELKGLFSKHIVDPIYQIPENYEKYKNNTSVLQKRKNTPLTEYPVRYNGYQEQQDYLKNTPLSGILKHVREDSDILSKNMARLDYHTRAEGATNERLLRLLQGLGTAGGVGLAGAGAAYGGYKGIQHLTTHNQVE